MLNNFHSSDNVGLHADFWYNPK